MARKATTTAPRIAVCGFAGVIRLTGSRGYAALVTAGAEINLDEVAGDRQVVDEDGTTRLEPQTVADLLGPLLEHFDIVGAAPVTPVAASATDEE